MSTLWCDECEGFAPHDTAHHVDLLDELAAEADRDLELHRLHGPADPHVISHRSSARQAGLEGRWQFCTECRGQKALVWFAGPKSALCLACQERKQRVAHKLLQAPSNMDRHTTAIFKQCSGYRITVEEFKTLEKAQDFRCAICKKRPRNDRCLHIDHDHETGRVRGLLCVNCNTGLGRFADNLKRLEAAAAYLEVPPADRLGIEGVGKKYEYPCA